MVDPASAATSLVKPSTTIKFLCSYGGRIVPRHPDGKLRYLGGNTRVLAVHRSISFPELLVKMGELCGASVSLRCQLPTEDLDALVSLKSDEDLTNLIEEYDRAPPSLPSTPLKIRAFLFMPRSADSPKSLSRSSLSSSRRGSASTLTYTMMPPPPPEAPTRHRCVHQLPLMPLVAVTRIGFEKPAGKVTRARGHVYIINHENHWR
ncbi:hypothetical protein Dimus_015139 [Dionaea muscipula]